MDEYSYLRGQYEEILNHCEYLLGHSADPQVLTRAYETKQQVQSELQRLNRMLKIRTNA